MSARRFQSSHASRSSSSDSNQTQGGKVARINIETKLWADPRFQDLMIKTGNRHAAKGMVLELFSLAQEYWYPGRKHIPRTAFERSGLGPTIETGLAELKDDGVKCVGSEDAFAWLFEKQEAGKKSAEARKAKFGSSIPRKTKKPRKKNEATNIVEQCSNGVEQTRTPTNTHEPPSPSPSPSLSSSSSSCSIYSVGSAPSAPSPKVRSPVGLFIATYVQAYQARYPGGRPDLRGKIQGAIKRYVQETQIERACEMIRTYCEMDDRWFLTKAHDFGTFIENLSKVGLKLDTGIQVNQTTARANEKISHAQDQLRRIAEGSL